MTLSEKLIGKLSKKEYRDAYMDEQVRTWIARQIRVLREQRGWSQTEFARRCGKPQSVISRLEDPDYGKISLQTLLDLRAAFDVGLEVGFVDYGTAIKRCRDLGRGAMEVASFDVNQLTLDAERPHTMLAFVHIDEGYPTEEEHRIAAGSNIAGTVAPARETQTPMGFPPIGFSSTTVH